MHFLNTECVLLVAGVALVADAVVVVAVIAAAIIIAATVIATIIITISLFIKSLPQNKTISKASGRALNRY
jgi:hypothetical protein